MGIRIAIAIALLLVCVQLPTQAAIIVEVQDSTVSANGTGFLDVFIRSDNNDLLDVFSITAEITGSVGDGTLSFSSSQTDIRTESNYVFLGDSGGYSTTVTSSTEMNANDGTASLNGVALSSTYLVARLNFEHNETGSSVGDSYSVTLIGVGTDPFSDKTWFADTGYAGIAIDTVNSDFVGTVTVTSAVPEPAMFSVLGVVGCLAFRKRRRR